MTCKRTVIYDCHSVARLSSTFLEMHSAADDAALMRLVARLTDPHHWTRTSAHERLKTGSDLGSKQRPVGRAAVDATG